MAAPFNRLGSIKDPALRVARARSIIKDLPADFLCDWLEAGFGRTPVALEIWLPVAMALESEGLIEKRAEAARTAAERGQSRALAALGFPPEDSEEEPLMVPDLGLGRPVSLGERKSLARRPDRKILDRIVFDPHPLVVESLLKNPHLTERDVLRVASRRPNRPEVLRVIFLNVRWVASYRVRVALVMNPQTPPPIGVRLVPHLTPEDRRGLFRTGGIHERVRAAARPAETLH